MSFLAASHLLSCISRVGPAIRQYTFSSLLDRIPNMQCGTCYLMLAPAAALSSSRALPLAKNDLSNLQFRATYTSPVNGKPSLRLFSLVIAVLLAVIAGLILTPALQATAWRGSDAPIVLENAHGHSSHMHRGTQHGHENTSSSYDRASIAGDCGDPASGIHGGGADCCSMGSCHAVQAIAALMLHTPCASTIVMTVLGDEQVEGIAPGGLDRPPRTA